MTAVVSVKVKATMAKDARHKCKSAHSVGIKVYFGNVVLSQKFKELLTMWCFT